MQKLKLKEGRSKSAFRTLSLAIRCGANLLPVKGMLYAMAHAKASRHVTNSQKQEVAASMEKMGKYMKELSLLATDLQKMRDVSGTTFQRQLKLATIAYVNLFYSMDNEKRDSYLESCAGHHGKKISNEQNLLLIPAIMASRGEPKSDVVHFLSSNIYKIPFRVLYHSSKAAVHIELLEQAMGIKSAPEGQMRNFSTALIKLEKRMKEIEDGAIKPELDEELKQEFVEEAIDLSQSSDMRVAEFISEKVMPNAFTDRIARRIIRRL